MYHRGTRISGFEAVENVLENLSPSLIWPEEIKDSLVEDLPTDPQVLILFKFN